MASLEIRIKRANKTFKEGDLIAGVIVITSKGELTHNGINLTMEGTVNLQLSARSVGLFEAFYNSLKPITLVDSSVVMAKPGKLPNGKTEIPFEIPLKPKTNRTLYETYHGVFVNIQYLLKCELKRTLLAKDVTKQTEFIVEYREQKEKVAISPVDFTVSPESLSNVKERANVPKFKVKGRLDSVSCKITEALTGQVIVENSEIPIKSIELQLVRVETCGCAEGYAKDATEIQNIQIADGDVARGVAIPVFMSFPRLFTCPTIATNTFKVEFEANVVIVLQDDHLITENFPIKLLRF